MTDSLYKNHLLGDDVYPHIPAQEGMVVKTARESTMGSDVCPLSGERLLLTWVVEVTCDCGILCSVRCSFSQDTWRRHLAFRMAL